MNNNDYLSEIFESVRLESAPDLAAKQRAKERMLAYANQGATVSTSGGIQMKRGGKSERSSAGMARSRALLKINKHHIQGAAAALLVAFGFAALMPVITQNPAIGMSTPNGLQGSLYTAVRGDAQEIGIVINPLEIKAAETASGETLTIEGLPASSLSGIKAENVFLLGFLSNFSVQSITVSPDDNSLIIDITPRETDIAGSEAPNGAIIISPPNVNYYYYGMVTVV